MSGQWKQQQALWAADTPNLRCALNASTGDLVIEQIGAAGPTLNLALPKFMCQSDAGKVFETTATVTKVTAQQERLWIDFETNSPFGLSSRGCITVDDSIDLDVEVTTVEPLSNLTLSMVVASEASVKDVATPGQKPTSVTTFKTQNQSIGLLADLRDDGSGQLDDSKNRLVYSFFQRSLEKGVVLVGRLRLLSATNIAEAELANQLPQWLEQRSFL